MYISSNYLDDFLINFLIWSTTEFRQHNQNSTARNNYKLREKMIMCKNPSKCRPWKIQIHILKYFKNCNEELKKNVDRMLEAI